VLVEQLNEELDVSIRRALLLALGEFGEKQVTLEKRALMPKLLALYQDDPDAGIHGAVEWLLLRWDQRDKIKEIEEQWRDTGGEIRVKREKKLDRIRQGIKKEKDWGQWYVNGQGQTMVVIPEPLEFLMGSPLSEAWREGGAQGKLERQHQKRIRRSFAIAAREVTVEQFLRFRKEHVYNKQYSPTGDCPANSVRWYDAAAYCNWLSKEEGIPEDEWCYLPNERGEYAEGMRLAAGYLSKTGYRLPSEAEWEYSCRARALTSRYYGEGEELLGKYVWYTKNSQDRALLPGKLGELGVPGGRLKPNDFGLFDMLGNALEWCQESFAYYPLVEIGKVVEDIEDESEVKDNVLRVFRGGSFGVPVWSARSANRLRNVPTDGYSYGGFRPARTFR